MEVVFRIFSKTTLISTLTLCSKHKVRVEIKVDIENIPIHMHMLHRSKHRVRVKIKVDIENSRQTTSWSYLKSIRIHSSKSKCEQESVKN